MVVYIIDRLYVKQTFVFESFNLSLTKMTNNKKSKLEFYATNEKGEK